MINNYFNKVDWSTNRINYWNKTKEGLNYRIWTEGRKLYVAYQHTIDNQDFKVDFDFWTRKDSRGLRLHRGFSRTYEASYYDVLMGLSREFLDTDEIIIIGYSAGSVYASLLYLDIKKYFPTYKVSTYAYACPNFILWGSDNSLLKDITYICNEGDLVTMCPPFYKKGENIVILKNKDKFPSLFNHLEEYYERSPI